MSSGIKFEKETFDGINVKKKQWLGRIYTSGKGRVILRKDVAGEMSG